MHPGQAKEPADTGCQQAHNGPDPTQGALLDQRMGKKSVSRCQEILPWPRSLTGVEYYQKSSVSSGR